MNFAIGIADTFRFFEFEKSLRNFFKISNPITRRVIYPPEAPARQFLAGRNLPMAEKRLVAELSCQISPEMKEALFTRQTRL